MSVFDAITAPVRSRAMSKSAGVLGGGLNFGAGAPAFGYQYLNAGIPDETLMWPSSAEWYLWGE